MEWTITGDGCIVVTNADGLSRRTFTPADALAFIEATDTQPPVVIHDPFGLLADVELPEEPAGEPDPGFTLDGNGNAEFTGTLTADGDGGEPAEADPDEPTGDGPASAEATWTAEGGFDGDDLAVTIVNHGETPVVLERTGTARAGKVTVAPGESRTLTYEAVPSHFVEFVDEHGLGVGFTKEQA